MALAILLHLRRVERREKMNLIEWVVEPGQDEGGDTYSVVNVETGEYAGTYESSYVAHVIRDVMNGQPDALRDPTPEEQENDHGKR